ncbi:MAG TPA: ImmA/IrrE family metallo-endopeptidase [Streptosporangiaceae bacterium]|nr:ImmA/IrrE family metallo-endopeptidase [Streptosporangiaceae bacterium]
MNALERHARRILGRLTQEDREAVAANPKQALTACFGLRVREQSALAHRRGAGGWCDGISFLDDGVIVYAPSPFSRRENFTLGHELGHKLTEDDDDALNWIADHDDPGRELERLCDRIAAELLLPAALVTQVLDHQAPAAAHVRAIYEASAASEVVCAIALAQRLPCQGAVIIMDTGSSTVTYASVSSPEDDGWPLAYPWPGQEILAHHRLPRLRAGEAMREKSWWATPWGEKQEYYLNAIAGSRRVHAVLAVRDLWEVSRFHTDKPETAGRPARHLDCPCGYHGTARGFPCSDCGQPYCPSCKECQCPRRNAALVVCRRCWVSVPKAEIVDGLCSSCY